MNGVGSEHPPPDAPCGPTITGVIDNRGPQASPNVLDGYVIEEGALPQALAPVIQAMLEVLPGKDRPVYTATGRMRHLFSRIKSRFLGPYAEGGSLNRTQTYLIMSHDRCVFGRKLGIFYLIMSHDSNEGIVSLTNDKPYLQFLGVGRTEHAKKLNDILANATKAIGGTLINSPFYAGEYYVAVNELPTNKVSFPPAGGDHGASPGRRHHEL